MSTPIVLFIEGVFTKDITLNSSLFDSDSSEDEEKSSYDKIPCKFTNLESWLTRTNISCAYCGLSHDYPPVFIPLYLTHDGANVTITLVKLLFCGFPCASKFIHKNYTGNDRERKMQGLKYVYNVFTGDDIDEFQMAPDISEIDIYGGCDATYTVNKFRGFVENLVPRDEYKL